MSFIGLVERSGGRGIEFVGTEVDCVGGSIEEELAG